jgi:phosphate transport system permease protein
MERTRVDHEPHVMEQKFVRVDPRAIKHKTMGDDVAHFVFLGLALLAASIIVIIVGFITVKGIQPFVRSYLVNGVHYRVNLMTFLFSSTWYIYPNTYGIGFVIINTLYIVALSLLLAIPISVFTALFVSKIAPKWLANVIHYVVELLASVPSIIYGLFGIGVITTGVNAFATVFGVQSAGGISVLATVIVLALMITPTITMLSITSIQAVKRDLIDGSLALGASITQTNFKVVLAGAKSGIISGIMLGMGRALGEATAISMVIGNAGSGPTFDLFATSRTLTSTILLGLSETTGMDYDIRFSVGIILVFIILLTNLLLRYAQKKWVLKS